MPDHLDRRQILLTSTAGLAAAAILNGSNPGHAARATPMANARLSYEDSCKRLQTLRLIDDGPIPRMPAKPPHYDDEEPSGVQFFRTKVGPNVDLSTLTLPRTFVGRSEINLVLMRNTDLAESVLCWNDFVDVDFSDATLTAADLRASQFVRCRFTGCDLREADLRHSDFANCDFLGANLTGALLARDQESRIQLSTEQRSQVHWQADAGPEPGGG